MSLQFILGGSGTGKSYNMYHEMIEKSVNNSDDDFIIIVPEQFTMQTQKDLVMMHPNRGMMNIDIVSFARLAYRVFEEVGEEALQVLDDTGKSLILKKIVEDKKEELGIYKNKIKMPGFISEMKSMISEIYQYGIRKDDIDRLQKISEEKPVLHTKLGDIKMLYTAFEDYLKDKYITTEEILEVLCKHIPHSDYIKGSEIYIDGFTGFTPIQYQVLGLLMKHAKNVIISLTIPFDRVDLDSIKEHHLFYLSKKTMDRLICVAGENNVRRQADIVLEDEVPYRFKESPSLAYLESNIFSYRQNKSYAGTPDIQIHIAKTPYKEAQFVAEEIFNLVSKKGLHYRDIAVVTGNIENYYRVFKEVFGISDIPYFIDYKRTLNANPFIEAVKSVLEMLESRFRYESVFRYLRSGMADIDRESVDLIENYVLARGIRGVKAWSEKWDLPDEILQIKDAVIAPVISLYEEWKEEGSTVKDQTTALYHFILSQNMFHKLMAYRQEFLLNNELDKAKEYEQVYKLVMDLLDKIVLLLGDERLSLKEYSSILETGFEEIKVGIIPPAIDQVVIGDIERTRLNHIRVLFFVGVNDGIIPKTGTGNSILTDSEREFLSVNGVELSPTAREASFIQKFYLYLNLTKPSRGLIISYSKSASDLSVLRPSYLIREIAGMFPDIMIVDEEAESFSEKEIISTGTAFSYLAEQIGSYRTSDMNPAAKDLYSILLKEEGLKDKINQLINAAFSQNENSKLDKAVASVLYGKSGNYSVSRLEKYAGCAYNHFLSYGLSLAPRKEYAVEAVDLGNLYHQAIELFSKRLSESSFNFRTVTDEFRNELVHECVREVTKEYGNTVLLSSARNSYIIKRVERITGRTVWALSEQIKRGKFDPGYYELSLGNGRIDRVDTYEEEDNLYIRIIDYKSGSTVFDIVDTYYHLQMQLIIYMGMVMEKERQEHPDKNIIPAAIGYYHISDPIINTGENLLEQFRMSGLVNRADSVIEAVDTQLEGKSIVYPITRRNGKLTDHANIVSADDFHKLIQYVRNNAHKLNMEILDGNIYVNPYKKKDFTSCDYCDYKAVCGFDTKLPSYKFRNLDKLKPEEVWEKIKGDEH